MPITIDYGSSSPLVFDRPTRGRWEIAGLPRGEPLADAPRRVAEALSAPLQFPPLAQSVLDSDQVAIVVEPGLPQAGVVVAAVVEAIAQCGVAPQAITVLRALRDANGSLADPRAQLDAAQREAVRLVTHDPLRPENIEYLAATRRGRSLYLNRAICDADVVITIGRLRAEPSFGYHGVHSGLYPIFSDTATQTRFRNPGLLDSSNALAARARREVESAGWFAGASITVQIVPGPGNTLLDVLAGEPQAVFAAGRARASQVWGYALEKQTSLVIAAISGGSEQQTWENAAAALVQAAAALEDDGTIALLSAIEQAPGPGLSLFDPEEDWETVLASIVASRPIDVLTALQVARVLQNGRLFMLSRLDEATLETLGIAPLGRAEEVIRLAEQHASCLVLPHAQYAAVSALRDTD